MTERPDLRIGDRDRDGVVTRLQQAHAEGRIDLSELDERVSAALAARFAGDLAALVADLPTPRTANQAAQLRPRGPGSSPADPLRLDGGWSTTVRTGRWTVPPFLRVDAGMGTVKADFLQAQPVSAVIAVEVVPSIGTIRFVLPAGWAVDHDRLSSSWGSFRSRVATVPGPGAPLLVLTGGVGMGSFKVRHASRRDLRRLER